MKEVSPKETRKTTGDGLTTFVVATQPRTAIDCFTMTVICNKARYTVTIIHMTISFTVTNVM